jgi:hypothetical protein
VSEFLAELREHWDDGYWWADRQVLLAIVVALIAGSLELVFVYLKARILRAAAEAAA